MIKGDVGQKKPQQAVREPTVDECAKIVRKLGECFEGGLYLDGLSDRKVGEALGLPWAVVAKVREKFIGPLKENPQVASLRSDIEQWMVMGEELKERVKRLEAA